MRGILMTMLGIVMMYSTMAQQIVGVEYYFDTDPGVGLGTYVSATSSGDDVTFDLNLNVNTLSLGYHNLGVRVKDANGNYSFGETRRLYIMELTTPTASSLVGGYEYFIDSDPGPGNGTYTALSGSSEQDKTIAVPISNLSAGYHYLGIRFKDVADNWSTNEFRKFYIIPSPSNLPSAKISKIEYFFDTDPGVGNGIVAATNLNADEIDETIAIDLTGKAVGDYTINVRVIDSQGVGSIYYQGEFEIRAVSTDATLSQITIDNESLSAFDAGTLSYDVSLPFGTTEINLGATSTEANANISGVGTIDVSSGSATVDVVVTAEDQTTTKTYTINFTVEKNTDATLSAISLNVGVLSPSFDAQTLSYSVSLPEGTEAVQLGATSTDDNATITGLGSIDVSSGSATVDVVVTAEDQTTTKTYTVSFYVLDLSLVSNGLVAYYPFNGNANDASGNGNHGVVNGGATLTDDRFGNANSAYSFDGNDDWINCGNNSSLNNTVQTISVWYNARTYNSNTVIARWQSFHEHVYSNQISCRYYAPSEIRFSAAISTPLNSWIHFVWVIDETSVSIYKNGDLVNSFGKSGELSFNANNILSIGCLYGWSGNTPTYLFDGLIDDVRIYNRALSQNEIETLYNLNPSTLSSNDASLSAITLDIGILNPVFSATTLSYDVTLPYGTTSVELGATTTDPNASEITGTGSIAITHGETKSVDIVVTAVDGATQQTYTVNFSTEPNNDASLSAITLDIGELDPAFDPATLSYTVSVPNGTQAIDIAATVNDPNADVAGAGILDLSTGSGTATLSVTAEDNSTTLDYVVDVTVENFGDPYLLHAYTFETNEADEVGDADGVLSGASSVSDGKLNLSGGHLVLPADIIDIPSKNEVSFEIVFSQANGLQGFYTLLAFGSYGELGTDYFQVQPVRGFDNFLRSAISCNNTVDPFLTETFVDLPDGKITDSEWHHIVVTISSSSMEMYLDGVSAGTASLSGDNVLSNVSNSFASIGLATYQYDPVWQGSIEEFNIYNGTLDADFVSTRASQFNVSSNDATLSAITLDIGALDPAFDPATLNYTVSVPNGTQSINVAGITNDPDANVTGAGVLDLSTGSGTATLSVTAEDKSTTLDYVVDVTVENFGDPYLLHAYTFETNEADEVGNADGVLSGASSVSDGKLNLSGGHLLLPADIIDIPSKNEVSFEIVFSQANGLQGFYSLLAFGNYGELGTDYFQVQPVRSFDNLLRAAISCNNTVDPYLTETVVDLRDGIITDTEWHHIVVTISSSSMEMYLDGVSVGTASLSGDNVLANVSNSFASLGLSTYQDDPVWQGSIEEFNIYNGTLEVDFVSKRSTHFIEPGSDASLSAITLDIGTLNPAFDSETFAYDVNLPVGTNSVELTAVSNDQNATIAGTGTIDVSSGSATVDVEVTAQDQTTLLKYTLNFTVDQITWNGTSWNNSTGPSETEDAIIAGDFTGGLTSANLEIKAGATVTVTGTLDIHGDLNNDGEIIVESGSTLLTYAGNQVTGSITIRRNTRYGDGKYSFVGSPVQQSAAITGQTLGPIVYQYNEATAFGSDGLARWQDASDSELMPGKGYAQANQKIVEFSGVPNSGAITYTGTYTSDTDDANEGWNLVSNPYAAAINTSSFLTENVNNTTGALYLWDDNGSDTGRGSNDDYITVNASGATHNNPANAGNAARYNNHLGSSQGFFMKLDETGNKQVVFTESMRVTGNNADDHFFRIAEDIQRVRINLVNEDGLFKQTLIAWNNEVDDEQISKLYDAQIFNQNADNAIYSYKNRIPLAIQTITDQKVSMDLGFNVAEAGVYSLQADISECQRVVYLIDHQTEEIIDLTNQEYVFSALQGKINDRFELTFEKQSILSTGVTGEWEVYASDHQVHFIPAEGAIPQNFRIFSLDGKLVFEELINQKAAVYLNVPEGVYLIAYGEQSQKILLH